MTLSSVVIRYSHYLSPCSMIVRYSLWVCSTKSLLVVRYFQCCYPLSCRCRMVSWLSNLVYLYYSSVLYFV